MYLCNDGHEEVCYEGRNCPVCEERKKVSDLEDEVFSLKEKSEDLKNQIEELKESNP